MIELFVLGRLDLKGVDADTASAILGQARPTALLAYLASRPDDYHRRDSVTALFWAESDQDSARRNLRKLKHTLHQGLGVEVIEARGNEDIRIKSDVLWSDVGDYEECVKFGKTARAIELYRGPLLPGFFVASAPGFQDWLDQTRRALARSAVKTALQAADQHLQNAEPTLASDLANFIRQREPELDDEHQLRKLITLLDRIGDRVGALQMYEAYRVRLLRDYKAVPSIETRRLIDTIRES